jgi:hypothetical protein
VGLAEAAYTLAQALAGAPAANMDAAKGDAAGERGLRRVPRPAAQADASQGHRRVAKETTMPYPCPACGFGVFDEPAGSYDICPICNWEDDEVQLRFPALRGGANKESLFEWQQRLLQGLPLHVHIHDGYSRCLDWRPLTREECQDTGGTPTTGKEYFDALRVERPKY